MPDNLLFKPRAEIEAIQEANFATMMDLCFQGHPYYRRVFSERGMTRGDFGSLADLPKLPVISKKDYAAEPESFVLKVEDLPEEMRVIWDVMHTTGTSGKPTPFYSTTYDFYNIITMNQRSMELRGVKDSDSFANLFPLTVYPYGGFHRAVVASYAMKIPVVSPLPGRPSEYFKQASPTAEVVRILERTRPTILWGMPSYVRRLLIQAEEMGADLPAARMILVTGEPCTDAMRNDLVRRLAGLGAADPQVLVSYGATEMQGGSIECVPHSGFHNPMPDDFYFEIVDPDTHDPLPDGERGLVALTHLNRRGTVLLRYSLGDLSILTREQCPYCGAWGERFTDSPSRADNLVKIRGMLVNPEVVVEILVADPGVAEYQVRIGRENPDDPLSMDRLTIRVAPSGTAAKDFEDYLVEKIKAAIRVTPRIEWVSKDDIYDPETSMKSKRLVDERR